MNVLAHRKLRGDYYEGLAAAHLKKMGLRILTMNYRTKLGELDIIADDGGVLVFVEVKGRQGGDPILSMSDQKVRRVRRMAEVYLAKINGWEREIRFDVILVSEDKMGKISLEHLQEAF
jgi:putative endonuclease